MEGQREDDKTLELSSLAQSLLAPFLNYSYETARVRRRGVLVEALQGGTRDRPHLAEHLAVKQPDTTRTEQTEQEDPARGVCCEKSPIPQAAAPEFGHICQSR
jgi:hypothetical protein